MFAVLEELVLPEINDLSFFFLSHEAEDSSQTQNEVQ